MTTNNDLAVCTLDLCISKPGIKNSNQLPMIVKNHPDPNRIVHRRNFAPCLSLSIPAPQKKTAEGQVLRLLRRHHPIIAS